MSLTQPPPQAAQRNRFQIMALAAGVDLDRLPAHVAIIMDGNGRWARGRGIGRLIGHRQGYNTLKHVLKDAAQLGIRYLTVYAFSAENWRRPAEEVDGLMKLIERAAREQLHSMHHNNVRVRVAGRLHEVPASLRQALEEGVQLTRQNTGITFTLAVNYGGRAEIVDAVRDLAGAGAEITEESISAHLYNPDVPEPDLMIRTAGEMRWSNFLLWQGAYAELFVTDVAWPDFGARELISSVVEYQRRTRKFGAVVE